MATPLEEETHHGYIYLLLRGDFIRDQKYIYKIGETHRYPPHKRLWDYPYGSIFLSVIQTEKHLLFEKDLKTYLNQAPSYLNTSRKLAQSIIKDLSKKLSKQLNAYIINTIQVRMICYIRFNSRMTTFYDLIELVIWFMERLIISLNYMGIKSHQLMKRPKFLQ